MTPYIKLTFRTMLAAAMMTLCAGCSDYLDKAPDSDIDQNEPYKNFRNFQGFVEELYSGIPCVTSNDYHNSWNHGEEEYWEPSDTRPLTYHIDQGDYRVIVTSGVYIYGFPRNTTGKPETNKKADKGGLWDLGWKCIRKANLGLENLEKLQNATSEEYDLIKGQMLFFRGWYHFMLMQYWGGLPYIDHLRPQARHPNCPASTIARPQSLPQPTWRPPHACSP